MTQDTIKVVNPVLEKNLKIVSYVNYVIWIIVFGAARAGGTGGGLIGGVVSGAIAGAIGGVISYALRNFIIELSAKRKGIQAYIEIVLSDADKEKALLEEKKKKDFNKKIWIGGIIVTCFIVLISIGQQPVQQSSAPSASNDGTYSKVDLINEAVRTAKAGISLPKQIDAKTSFVDITAESNAIRYHYILSDLETSNISDNSLKNYLGPTVCQNKDTRNVLDQGINLEYSYTVKGAAQTYFVSFSQSDCLQ